MATHLTCTAESDAAFLLPHIKKSDKILDVGCGPGTITTNLAKYTSDGHITGIDISEQIILKAKHLAGDAGIPTEGAGAVTFKRADGLSSLPFPDDTFDSVFASQVFGHFTSQDQALRALVETRRVLKPGGIVATRDGAA